MSLDQTTKHDFKKLCEGKKKSALGIVPNSKVTGTQGTEHSITKWLDEAKETLPTFNIFPAEQRFQLSLNDFIGRRQPVQPPLLKSRASDEIRSPSLWLSSNSWVTDSNFSSIKLRLSFQWVFVHSAKWLWFSFPQHIFLPWMPFLYVLFWQLMA